MTYRQVSLSFVPNASNYKDW